MSQEDSQNSKKSFFITPEINLGKTLEANTDFPNTELQKNIFLSIGRYNNNSNLDWAVLLNFPKTGLTVGYTDFGNSNLVGHAYSLLPFAEFKILKRLNLQVGLGGSYIDTTFDRDNNPNNRGVSTDINWSFRSFLYYNLIEGNSINWRLGLGYLHHSNGHTKLPNQGLNSLGLSLSAEISNPENKQFQLEEAFELKKQTQNYISARFGIGQNVLSETFNDKKEVYSLDLSYGKIYQKTFKFGIGLYYRVYEHYYDYIKNNELLVQEDYSIFKENPYGYATNIGVFGSGELLLSHIGFEFNIGLNIYKPAYKIDWKLNDGYSFIDGNGELVEVLGELNWYYEIKRTVSTRLGLKYYLFNTNNTPKHNIYLGAFLNANLGQADYTELGIGYVHRFNYQSK